MDILQSPSNAQVDLTLGAADQSCKECRRRKARCDRTIPTCSHCTRYNRHCLYEKHSRTPLTRRHLTEVEERLERAEALIKRLQKDSGAPVKSDETSAEASNIPHEAEHEIDTDSGNFEQTTVSREDQSSSEGSQELPAPIQAPIAQALVDRSTPKSANHNQSRKSLAPDAEKLTESRPGHALAETPPRDDFEWEELDMLPPPSSAATALVDTPDDSQTKDGMASLAVDEKDGGYLGIASGAAFLRFLEPSPTKRTYSNNSLPRYRIPMTLQPDPNRHIVDAMIDAYFSTYHLNYPIIHEPTFRAQYSEVIPQPHGRSWSILAYIVAAIGVYSSSDTSSDVDLQLFAHARSLLSFDFLEIGNSTLVQALTLISNYQQKRDKPNSGYNYLGLAVRMATSLGFHKEFPGWNIPPLKMEMRRRIWWSLCVFDVGATITFSRPVLWPYEGVEVSFPMNVTDRELTANATSYPPENVGVTPYTAVSTQARFHVSTNEIYARVISKPFPTASELLQLDDDAIGSWQALLSPSFNETSTVPPKYAFAHAVMRWRYRNFRIIMYRPFVIRRALNAREREGEDSGANQTAYQRCLDDAKTTIDLISEYWSNNEHNRLAGWYALYFLFQAALIPCICLRNSPFDAEALSWSQQITKTLHTIEALAPSNNSAVRCHQVIMNLCGRYISWFHSTDNLGAGERQLDENNVAQHGNEKPLDPTDYGLEAPVDDATRLTQLSPIDESPQTQLGNLFPMMWPNVNALEAQDEVMGDDSWLEFLR